MARIIPRGWQELEIKDFLKFIPREVEKPKDPYLSLGLRSHCKGTFIREVDNPDKVMMDTLYAVKKDDFIVNITFAWEGAVALVKKSDEGALVSHRFPTYVFDRDVVIPEYFRYWIPSTRFISELGIISPGGAGRNRVLDRKDFLHMRFVIPPVNEQKRIAQILLVWDKGIESLDKVINAKIRLKRKVIRGLLQRGIGCEKFKRSAIGLIPSTWKVERLENLCVEKPNYGANASSIDYRSELPRYVRITDILENGSLSKDEMKSIERENAKNCILSEGDIVFARTGATVGKTYLYRKSDGECAFAGYLIRFKPNRDKLLPEFLFQVTHSDRYYQWVQGMFRAGAQPNINGTEYSSFLLAVPSVSEQYRITTVLSNFDREIEILFLKLGAFKKERKWLIQKLLTGKIRVKV